MDGQILFVLSGVHINRKYTACVKIKNEITASLDRNIEEGLDKYLNYTIGHLKMILTTEQKRSDFKVEDSDADLNLSVTSACQKSTVFLHSIMVYIKENLDGPNKKNVLTELGLRFHRLLMEHLVLFVYTYTGAIKVLCDVTEYRKVIEIFEIPTLLNIMEATHMLCNLLIVPPENLKQVATDAQLTTGTLDKNVVMSFIQLRHDFKTKIGKNFVL
ncbi:hypothetical protein LOD99_199 [Oopsacas minuta]|uniref:Exocyst complex component Sec10-like alpha-helical bundle domain-containing protein n=1 Tax=Oopsacas minuta TaxID=111878 RepID=A0AAV7K8I6_9METZ|nr:hypothetical protein LOD99_199 [Oopsacas minuta]